MSPWCELGGKYCCSGEFHTFNRDHTYKDLHHEPSCEVGSSLASKTVLMQTEEHDNNQEITSSGLAPYVCVGGGGGGNVPHHYYYMHT